jgi:cardiolipin synthase
MKELYDWGQYYAELMARTARCGEGDRVAVVTMAFAPQVPEVAWLVEELCAAARRGVEVRLVVDAYSFLSNTEMNELGPMVFDLNLHDRKLPEFYRMAYEALEKLSEAGGHYVIINRPRRRLMNPLAGRSHMKFAVIGEWAAVGSCNLNTSDHVNLTVGGQDRRTSAWLWELAGRLVTEGRADTAMGADDVEYEVDEATTLLLDAGARGRSLILERAMEMVDAAKEYVLITCQFFPNDATAKHLRAAHERGVEVEIIYNHPAKHGFPNNLLHRVVERTERWVSPESFFAHTVPAGQKFMHAKLIATEQGAMIGSHNYVTAGVKLGTAEIAVECRDPQLASRAAALMCAAVGR